MTSHNMSKAKLIMFNILDVKTCLIFNDNKSMSVLTTGNNVSLLSFFSGDTMQHAGS